MVSTFLSENIEAILSIARHAPSVHNTQPWSVKLDGGRMLVKLEHERLLEAGDPVGRQAFISLGIFVEALVIAMESLGYSCEVRSVDRETLSVTPNRELKQKDPEDAKALRSRVTDRSIYAKTGIGQDFIKNMERRQIGTSRIIATTDASIIELTASLTRKGLSLAMTSYDFRKELVQHLVKDSGTPYGIPLSATRQRKLRPPFARKIIQHGLSRKKDASTEYKRWASASGLVFVLSEGDTAKYWLEGGRLYMRAAIEIEKAGFAQATSAAIVEASDFHEDIEKILGTKLRILAVIRIGQGKELKKHSGRLDVEKLIST